MKQEEACLEGLRQLFACEVENEVIKAATEVDAHVNNTDCASGGVALSQEVRCELENSFQAALDEYQEPTYVPVWHDVRFVSGFRRSFLEFFSFCSRARWD